MIKMEEKGFIFDYAKCVGCHACIAACYVENKTKPPILWRQVNSYNSNKIPLAGYLHLSIACNHCKESPCLFACPANAYSKDDQTGAIIHNPEKCIGCKYCTWACPFDAPKYNEIEGIIEKCNFCNQRIKDGLIPSCANNCPTGALSFGIINDSVDSNSIGITNSKIQPRINTIRSNIVDSIPEMNISVTGFNNSDKNSINQEEPISKIQSLHEWPLVIFTLISALLVGWSWALKPDATILQKVVFISLGIISILLSALHLGKPLKSYRSILNFKSSWLSREIILCGLFNFLAIIYFFAFPFETLRLMTSIVGIVLLFSIEMVYSITKKNYKVPIHSANTILTAIMFALLFNHFWKLTFAVVAIKTLLYIIRKSQSDNDYNLKSLIFNFMRILIGSIIPISIIGFSSSPLFFLIFIMVLLGEVIDRFEYYDDIYVTTPTLSMYNKLNKEIDLLCPKSNSN